MEALSPRRRTALLAVIALSLMTVVSAVSGLNVALPSLQRDTGATQSEIQWIVDAYTLVFAGLLLAAGALGDRFGRKPVLLAGLAIFGSASAFGLFVSDPTMLIAMRAAMGVGAAAVMPVTLSVITTSFPPEERAKAVGVWVGVAGGGAVVGLFGSGLLLEFFEWNSFFALNVTLAALGLIGSALVVPNSRDAHPPALDPLGALLSLALVGGLVFGFIEGGERGWGDAMTVTGFVVGILAAVAFVAWELRQESPLLDPRLFRLRGFSTGALSIALQFFASFGFFFIVLQYLQYVAGLSPLQAACALLPLPVVLIPLARRAPALAQRFGTNRVASLGLALSAVGMLLLTQLGADLVYWKFAGAVAVFAAGMALASTPATMAITASLPASKQGVGSAVNDVSREFGSALGIAILGSVLNDQYRANLAPAVAGLPRDAADAATSSLAAVHAAAPGLGDRGQQLLDAANQAFVDATGGAFLVAAAVLALGAVIVAVRAPNAQELAVDLHAHDTAPAPGSVGPTPVDTH
ncbi:MFS transporter [Nocardioides sp.]|uniref:MFS transporter n=1 Tax=Nocardioides sp. TaxID=35761 RepID=UPI003D0B09AB